MRREKRLLRAAALAAVPLVLLAACRPEAQTALSGGGPVSVPASGRPPSAGGSPTSDGYAALSALKATVDARILSWDLSERARQGSPASESGALILLPVDAFSPLLGWPAADQRQFEYGIRTVVFDARRAAQYAAWMRPDMPLLRAFDLSMADGSTPADSAGLRHPKGSHIQGTSVDLSYLGPGSPPPTTLDELDVEATAWVMYSLFESPSVESILSAYRAPILAAVERWYAEGIVGEQAVTRFRDDLWQDDTLNHGAHMHVNTGTQPALLLDAGNDYYRCYRVAVGSWGTMWSRGACASP